MFTRLTGAASLAAAIALPFVLSACSSSDSGSPMAQGPEPIPPSASSLQEAVAGSSTAMAAAVAATSEPRPGSVTQSSNPADRVEVTNFDPDNNSFTIRNAAAGAGWEIGTGNARPLDEEIGADGGVGLVQRVTGGQRVVIAYPRAAEEENTDWLAAGIWAFIPDSEVPGDYEFGAFADGGDPFDDDNLQALTGTARYEGQAIGVYYVSSTSSPSDEEGDAGPFTADVALMAEFGSADALGSISGTVSDVETSGGSLEATLTLGTASIGDSNGGFFAGDTAMAFGGRTYAGRWGGQFFGNGAATDAPASVAGTFGATTSEAGATGSLVGAFGAERTPQ